MVFKNVVIFGLNIISLWYKDDDNIGIYSNSILLYSLPILIFFGNVLKMLGVIF